MNYEFGDIILVDFPFSSNLGVKKRPAVVISSGEFNTTKPDLVMMAITSKIDNLAMIGEAKIKNFKTAGLLKESAFKSVIFTIEKQIIYKTLGKLDSYDLLNLKKCLSEIIT